MAKTKEFKDAEIKRQSEYRNKIIDIMIEKNMTGADMAKEIGLKNMTLLLFIKSKCAVQWLTEEKIKRYLKKVGK